MIESIEAVTGNPQENKQLEFLTDPKGPIEMIEEISKVTNSDALPRYVTREVTRHGREVYYYRPKKGIRYRLRSAPGTPEFETAVANARAGKLDQPKSFVYFALAGNKVKIGTSKDPRARLGGIQTGSAAKVRIYYVTPGDRAKERELHSLFAEYRVNGEWFLYAQPIRDWIARNETERRPHPTPTRKTPDRFASIAGGGV